MPKQTLPLNDTKIRATEAIDKPVHLFDGGGLFLLVQPKGGKWWRFKYQFAGKTKTISFGTYPEVSLKEARNRREQARSLVAHGTGPAVDRKEQKRAEAAQAITFDQVFNEWLDIEKSKLADTTYNKIKTSMTIHAPRIGQQPIGYIGVEQLLTMLRAIEAQGARGVPPTWRADKPLCPGHPPSAFDVLPHRPGRYPSPKKKHGVLRKFGGICGGGPFTTSSRSGSSHPVQFARLGNVFLGAHQFTQAGHGASEGVEHGAGPSG